MEENMLKLRIFFIRLFHWEFWPIKVLYFPVFIYYLWLSLKARSFFFFSATNPGMETGGLYGLSKYRQLIQLSEEHIPKTLIFDRSKSPETVLSTIHDKGLRFPVIIKPDQAERGIGVEKINSEKELVKHLESIHYDFLIQEFVEVPFEAGVFYIRYPGERAGKIPSLVIKNFLKVCGDGRKTVGELAKRNHRAAMVWRGLVHRQAEVMDYIPEKGEEILLEPIGNHNRGTTFINGNKMISKELAGIFDKITQHLDGFCYGRLDVKAPSREDFLTGKGIKVLEVNGVGSEPAHIYHPGYSLLKAWKTLFKHWTIIYRISKINKGNGVSYMSFREAFAYYGEWKAIKR